MSKLSNFNVRVSSTANPYHKRSFKFLLMKWALERGEFSKEEFLQAHDDLKLEHEIDQKAGGKAWWNEFYNKHKVFVDVE